MTSIHTSRALEKEKTKAQQYMEKIDKKAALSQELPRDAVTLVQKACT